MTSESHQLDALAPEEREQYLAYSARAEGTNINPQTLLATDYLNHFNEIVMLLDMVPDMPDIFDEVQAWQPKSYQNHFRDSLFHDRALAIDVYEHAPACYRRPFDEVIEQMNDVVIAAVERIAQTLASRDQSALRSVCTDASRGLQKMMDVASAIIHGSVKPLAQVEIDGFLAG